MIGKQRIPGHAALCVTHIGAGPRSMVTGDGRAYPQPSDILVRCTTEPQQLGL